MWFPQWRAQMSLEQAAAQSPVQAQALAVRQRLEQVRVREPAAEWVAPAAWRLFPRAAESRER
jgi:hypothetical protein